MREVRNEVLTEGQNRVSAPTNQKPAGKLAHQLTRLHPSRGAART